MKLFLGIIDLTPLQTNDLVQIAVLAILAWTLYCIHEQVKTQNAALETQNRVHQAQVLRDSFEMYWKTWEPVSDKEVNEFRIFHGDYIPDEKYPKYKDDTEKIKIYINVLRIYTYLAFSYSLQQLKLPEQLGPEFTEEWVKELMGKYPEDFKIINDYLKDYYKDFNEFLNKLQKT